MKKFKIAAINCGGFNQIGFQATKNDFIDARIFNKRVDANAHAQQKADWCNQQGIGYLVCRKTPRKGWIVVDQF